MSLQKLNVASSPWKMHRKGQFLQFCLVALLFLMLGGRASQAATITVVNLNDSGAGSLRQAIADATSGDTIDFAVTGTITLTSGVIGINKNLIIAGPGASSLTISGNNASRIFWISLNAISDLTVMISGLTLSNGNGDNQYTGGAIYNSNCQLTVNDSVFIKNKCIGEGGAIYSTSGSSVSRALNLSNCTFTNNSAGYDGGAIHNSVNDGDSKALNVNNCTFSNNKSNYQGGAIYTSCNANKSIWTVNNCNFNNNSSTEGGALYTRCITSNNIAGIASLTVDGSTFIGNSSAISNQCRNNGSLTLAVKNSLFNGNYSSSGAALKNVVVLGKIVSTVDNSILSNNGGPDGNLGDGSAIYNYASVGGIDLTVNNSTLSNNKAKNGGAIYSYGAYQGRATLTVNNSTLNGNRAINGAGGAISSIGESSTGAILKVNNSTLSDNSASSYGGAIASGLCNSAINGSTLNGNTAPEGGAVYSARGSLTITNSTLSENTAATNGAALYSYGFNQAATATLNNCTVSDNRVSDSGGAALFSIGTDSVTTLTLRNTLLNHGYSSANLAKQGGNIVSKGYNLSNDDGGGFLTGPGDLINTDPKLDPAGLADNGGPTKTIALLAGSPAINAGQPSYTGPLTTDQRGAGFPRVQGGRLDIGALEPVMLSANNVAITEGNSGTKNLAFTVSLTQSIAQTVTVDFATANGTASAGSDYTAQSGTLSIAAGQTTAVINVPIVGDTIAESNDTLFVNLSNPINVTLKDNQIGGIIINDDIGPSLSINDVTFIEGNSGMTDATFTVTLSAPSTQTVSVNAIPYNGNAKAPADYTSGGKRLIFAPGVTTQTFSVPVKGDLLSEADETFFVVLSSSINATILRGQGIGTIRNDDAPPTVSIEDASIKEGNTGQSSAVLHLKLSAPSGQVVTVNCITSDGTAKAGVDYLATDVTVVFTTGSTDAYVRVTIIGDTADETDETFNVNLSNASEATIARGQAVGTIIDDDVAPTISISDANINEGNNGTKTLSLNVNLSAPSGQAVTVNFATADGTAHSDSDYVAQTGMLTFAAGQTSQTVSVVIKGDTLVENDESFYVFLSAAINASISKARGTGTILNDDASG